MEDAAEKIERELIYHSLIEGGSAGKREDLGLDRGLRGDDGINGSVSVALLRPTSQIGVDQVPFVFAHPLQCKMALERADTYFYLGSNTNRALARQILLGLIERLSFATPAFVADLATGNPSLPLAKAYTGLYKSVESAHRVVTELQALRKSANDMFFRLSSTTVDYYGYPQQWVPRTSYTELNRMMDDSLLQLAKVEEEYLTYLNEYEQKSKLDAHVATVAQQTDVAIKAIEADLEKLNELITQKYIAITTSSRTDAIVRAQKDAKRAIEDFKDSVSGKFKISPKSFLSAMTNFAASPSAALGAASGASLLYEGFSSVPNIGGDPVPKALLIKQIKNGGANVDALSKDLLEVTQQADGSLAENDEFSTKVLTTLENMETLIDEFADDTFGSTAEVSIHVWRIL